MSRECNRWNPTAVLPFTPFASVKSAWSKCGPNSRVLWWSDFTRIFSQLQSDGSQRSPCASFVCLYSPIPSALELCTSFHPLVWSLGEINVHATNCSHWTDDEWSHDNDEPFSNTWCCLALHVGCSARGRKAMISTCNCNERSKRPHQSDGWVNWLLWHCLIIFY